ncbi:extensin family protein [Aliiruegeria lutimaris]|uniref:Extensin-like protein C-terminus n=1 Tax=Aliiruegeria lutimaris TaxID=571298 RepID=A0A1G8PQS1_9RHOB|nr:extensin family protein [Aliiruegeria lutimaris]SDI94688.1 Extensin-like protein C-terminus [Aliiruegeria lutimaris]
MTIERRNAGRGLGSLVRLGFCAALLFSASISAAEAPSVSLRPVPRVTGEAPVLAMAVVDSATLKKTAEAPDATPLSIVTPAGVPVHTGAEIRPRPRGGLFHEQEVAADSQLEVTRMVTRIHFNSDTRPTARPVHPLAGYSVIPASANTASRSETTYPKARPAAFGKLFRNRAGGYSRKGSICGVNGIKGTVKASFGNPGRGCGIANPVRVTSIAGVTLSQPATIDCETAKALNNWVENGIKPAIGRKGGGVKELKVAAHYSCRNRNNRSGGRLSEHAKGNAVDISAIRLNNGTELSVASDWRSRKWSKTMREIHRSACGPFGTVLGPNADRYHQDHFHVDTARYRSGSYCR